MTDRGIAYPQRYLGSRLEELIKRIVQQRPELHSQAGVARWLGFPGRSRIYPWIAGRSLPAAKADLRRLLRLGISEEELHRAIRMDKLHAFALDAGVDPEGIVHLAIRLALAAGVQHDALEARVDRALDKRPMINTKAPASRMVG